MKKLVLLFSLIAPLFVHAQVDTLMQHMMDSMNAAQAPVREFTHATFKGTRLINFPTNETMGKHALDFRIQHRFGEFSSGAYNAFGTDGPACIRLSFDYGITDWLQIGIGRTSIDKLLDASFKVRALRQTTDNKVPISITWQSSINYTFLKDPGKAATGVDKYHYWPDRISYGNCLIIARKFSEKFSLGINSFWVHYNIVDLAREQNDIFAIGITGRYKLKSRFAITWEYAHRINKYSPNYDQYHDPLGIGFDLETGGHIFQVHLTNQFGMNEAQYIPYTTSDWFATDKSKKVHWQPGFRLGFNISRVFAIGGHGGNGW